MNDSKKVWEELNQTILEQLLAQPDQWLVVAEGEVIDIKGKPFRVVSIKRGTGRIVLERI